MTCRNIFTNVDFTQLSNPCELAKFPCMFYFTFDNLSGNLYPSYSFSRCFPRLKIHSKTQRQQKLPLIILPFIPVPLPNTHFSCRFAILTLNIARNRHNY